MTKGKTMEQLLQNYHISGKKLPIKTYPDPVLSSVARDVEPHEFNGDLKNLCLNMLYTMYHAPGIGLAAPQIGISKRIFVLDVNYTRTNLNNEDEDDSFDENEHEVVDISKLSNLKPQIFINPIIESKTGERSYQEGCLSLPGVYEDVKRADKITVKYQDTDGNHHSVEADELLAICIQHENDHLDGIVFIDRLSTLKKNFFKQKLIKEKKRSK
jgi:peptide deformylase